MGHAVDHAHRQPEEQENRDHIQEPLAHFREGRKGGNDPLMIGSQLAQVHAQPGDQPVQNQFQKRDQQHELDRVLEQQRLVAQLSGDALDGGCSCGHAYLLSLYYVCAAVTARRSSALARAM